MKSYEERILIFQQENEELRQLNEQLQAEVNSVQRMASFTDPGTCQLYHVIATHIDSHVLIQKAWAVEIRYGHLIPRQ